MLSEPRVVTAPSADVSVVIVTLFTSLFTIDDANVNV
jgi:hypothetical protein